MFWLILGIPFGIILMFAAWYDYRQKKNFYPDETSRTNNDYAYAQSISAAQYNGLGNTGGGDCGSGGGIC